MDKKNTVEITVNGRKCKLSGEESPAYMQKVADYVNSMYEKLKEFPGFVSRSHDYQTMMMYMNMADENLKQSGWTEEKQAEADTQAQEEIYRLKLDLVEARKQAEASESARLEETVSLKKQLEVVQEERRRLADRDKAATAKAAAQEKELSTYKTNMAVLKRKLADYEKNEADVEKQLKESAAREREEKLQRNKYENLLKSQKQEFETKLSQMKEQMEKKKTEEKQELEKLLLEQQKQLASLQKQLDEQEADYGMQLAEMKAECDNRISSLKPGYEKLMDEQEQEHRAKIRELTGKYEAEIAEINSAHAAEHEELEMTRKKMDEAEGDMIEYLDLLEEKEKEIARLKFKLQEQNQYE